MVETRHLQPPASGPQSDPTLFGVAEALARLFPVEHEPLRAEDAWSEPADEKSAEEALAA